MLCIQLSTAISSMWWDIQLWGLGSQPILLSSTHYGEGFSFSGIALPSEIVGFKYVVGVTAGSAGVVIGYQFDEFTHTWSVQCFIAQSHIYPSVMG